jgi:streptomycin 6-kinase
MSSENGQQRERNVALDVQPLVRQKAAHLGARGREWLAHLPEFVSDLERHWSITVGAPFSGGTTSYVCRAVTHAGEAAVLKLTLPDEGFSATVRLLEAAQGNGYVRLLAHDTERYALLLEALGAPLNKLDLTPEQQMRVLARTLRRAWHVPRCDDAKAEVATEKAAQLGELVGRLWESLGRPCSKRVRDQALAYAASRAAAFNIDRCVVVHGDPHPANALSVTTPRAGAESGFVFVDPDGFLADPAYDVGVVLRDWSPQLLAGDTSVLARRYCRLLAEETGVDERAVWEWGFLERVSSGLYIMQFAGPDLYQPFLDTAERL